MSAAHLTLVFVHAASGIVGFVFGMISLRPRARGVPYTFRLYLGSLWLMTLSLIAVVAVDWPGLGVIGRCVYGALTLLALYTCWRGWRALRILQSRTTSRESYYIDDVGFTLIVLFVGFVAIGVLDLGSPIWLVVVVGALCILAGRFGVRGVKESLRVNGSMRYSPKAQRRPGQ